MTQEMLRSPSYPSALRFAVVITDGHVTGNPCGGIKVAAERARDENIQIFVVAASKNVEETGLKEIANSPSTVYRNNFMAVDLSQGRAIIQTQTIDHIINTMVTHRHTQTYTLNMIIESFSHTCFFFVFTETFVVCRGKTINKTNDQKYENWCCRLYNHWLFVLLSYNSQCYNVTCLETKGPSGPKGHRGQKVSFPHTHTHRIAEFVS